MMTKGKSNDLNTPIGDKREKKKIISVTDILFLVTFPLKQANKQTGKWKSESGTVMHKILLLNLSLVPKILTQTLVLTSKYHSALIQLFKYFCLVSFFSLCTLSWIWIEQWQAFGLKGQPSEAFNFLLDSLTDPWITTINADAKKLSQRRIIVSES